MRVFEDIPFFGALFGNTVAVQWRIWIAASPSVILTAIPYWRLTCSFHIFCVGFSLKSGLVAIATLNCHAKIEMPKHWVSWSKMRQRMVADTQTFWCHALLSHDQSLIELWDVLGDIYFCQSHSVPLWLCQFVSCSFLASPPTGRRDAMAPWNLAKTAGTALLPTGAGAPSTGAKLLCSCQGC